MADESESDDGALHAIFRDIPPERIRAILFALAFLARVRGAVTPDIRARAQELADDPVFSLADHPVIQRILAAP